MWISLLGIKLRINETVIFDISIDRSFYPLSPTTTNDSMVTLRRMVWSIALLHAYPLELHACCLSRFQQRDYTRSAHRHLPLCRLPFILRCIIIISRLLIRLEMWPSPLKNKKMEGRLLKFCGWKNLNQLNISAFVLCSFQGSFKPVYMHTIRMH